MNRERFSLVAAEAETGPPSGLLRGHPSVTAKGKWHTRLRLTVILFLVWTAVGMFQVVPGMFRVVESGFYISKLIESWAWALITPAILLIDRKLSSRDQNISRIVAILIALSVPFSLLYTLLAGILLYPFPRIWWGPLRNHDFAVYYIMGGWFTYFAIVGVLQAFNYYSRFLSGQMQLERVERSLVEARLNALRLHLEPHFLFNALNTISSEVAENPKLARTMIGDLGALLRRSLDTKDSAEITLARELALLEHYLSIQRVRFGDRMEIRIDVEPEVLSAMVPSMLLQPLVENAIRHGIEGRMSGGNIVVSGKRAGEQLRLRVADDGVGLPRDWQLETSSGHGLRVTLERLRALYPELGEQCLSIRRGAAGGTEVELRIPLHAAGRHGAIA